VFPLNFKSLLAMPRGGRTSIKGTQAYPIKHAKNSETFLFKHAVLQCLEDHGISQVRLDFYPKLSDYGWATTRKNVYRWAERKGEIAAGAASSSTSSQRYQ
jgi:hypothetical protein